MVKVCVKVKDDEYLGMERVYLFQQVGEFVLAVLQIQIKGWVLVLPIK
jgi:hypothetical protein